MSKYQSRDITIRSVAKLPMRFSTITKYFPGHIIQHQLSIINYLPAELSINVVVDAYNVFSHQANNQSIVSLEEIMITNTSDPYKCEIQQAISS